MYNIMIYNYIYYITYLRSDNYEVWCNFFSSYMPFLLVMNEE